MYDTIALRFGFAEDSCTSWLILSTDGGSYLEFNTKREAIKSLAVDLYNKYKIGIENTLEYINSNKEHMAQCCQSAWRKRDKNTPPSRCPVCDAKYDSNRVFEFYPAIWSEYLEKKSKSISDTYGDDGDWSPWFFDFKTSLDNIVVVPCNAGEVLLMALFEEMPELNNTYNSDDNYFNANVIETYKYICAE